MTDVILKISEAKDLALLLQLVERLGISYTQKLNFENGKAKPNKVSGAFFVRTKKKRPLKSRLALVRQAANDPIFRSDEEEVMNDFAHEVLLPAGTVGLSNESILLCHQIRT